MLGFLFLLVGLTPVHAATPEECRDLVKRGMELVFKDDDRLSDFLFVRRRETRELEADGKVRSSQSLTVRREMYEDIPITRVIARGDKALAPGEVVKQNETIRQRIGEWRARQAEAAARPKTPPGPRKPSDDELLLRELPDALDFRHVATEQVNGREVLLIEFESRPGYSARSMRTKILEKVRGKTRVEKESGQALEVEATVFDNIGVGFGLLGRVGKGTEFRMKRREAAPGKWVPEWQNVRFDVRIMLVKSMRREIDTRFSEFQLKPEAKLAQRF